MRQSAFSFMRTFLEEMEVPVPREELCEKTGANIGDIYSLENAGVIDAWYKLTKTDIPLDEYSKNFLPLYKNDAERLVDYMLREPDRLIRRDELQDVLELYKNNAEVVLGALLSWGLLAVHFTLVLPASCEICFNRDRCNVAPEKRRQEKAKGRTCHLFRSDWRLNLGGKK